MTAPLIDLNRAVKPWRNLLAGRYEMTGEEIRLQLKLVG